MLDWPDTSCILPALADFHKEELLDVRPVEGIYLLLDDHDRVVYVGTSNHISRRLSDHRREGSKAFQRAVWYQIVGEMSRLRTEGILILYFLPKYNRGLNLGMSNDRLWEIRWKRPTRPK